MNTIFKASLRLATLRPLLTPFRAVGRINNAVQQRQITRNLWFMTKTRQDNTNFGIKLDKHSETCHCGCGKHTKEHVSAESELVQFLTEEILEERKAQKSRTIPTELGEFKAKLNGSEVTLERDAGDEKIVITFNVNHTLDSGPTDFGPQETSGQQEIGELKSKPEFKVNLTRGGTTLSLLCSYLHPDDQDEGYNDIFGIDEVCIYNGEWNEKVYSVAGSVLESYLYDLLLNYLEEKGISNDFVDKLSAYSTAYEHSAYISFLEGLSKFVSGK